MTNLAIQRYKHALVVNQRTFAVRLWQHEAPLIGTFSACRAVEPGAVRIARWSEGILIEQRICGFARAMRQARANAFPAICCKAGKTQGVSTSLTSKDRPFKSPTSRGAHHAGVAQLVRAPACHAGGRGFEPRLSRHFGDIFQPVSSAPDLPSERPANRSAPSGSVSVEIVAIFRAKRRSQSGSESIKA
jgi:hypothetical protein